MLMGYAITSRCWPSSNAIRSVGPLRSHISPTEAYRYTIRALYVRTFSLSIKV